MRSQAVWCACWLIALTGCAEGFSAGDPLGLALAGAGSPSGDPLGLDTCSTENEMAACNCPGAARMGVTTCLPNSASSTGFAFGDCAMCEAPSSGSGGAGGASGASASGGSSGGSGTSASGGAGGVSGVGATGGSGGAGGAGGAGGTGGACNPSMCPAPMAVIPFVPAPPACCTTGGACGAPDLFGTCR